MDNTPTVDADSQSRDPLVESSGSDVRHQLAKALRRLLDDSQRRLSLNVQRSLLLAFLLIQALFVTGYLVFERELIEQDAIRTLRNTALQEAQRFETSMDALRYQVRVIGNALLLNHTVALENVQPFLAQELKKDWLDAVIVINAEGDFVAKASAFPLEQALSASVRARASFRDEPLFVDLRRDDVNERLFVWHGNASDPDFTGFVVYRAIRDREGRYLGGIIGYFNSATMATMLRKMESRGFDLGPGGVMAVLDRDNGAQLARVGAGADIVRPGHHSFTVLDFAGDSAQPRRYVSPVDGVNRLGVFLNLNERKWVLVVALAEHELLRGWYLQTVLIGLAFLIIAVLQWLLLHYARTNFLQRERLTREARRDPLTDLANRRHFDEWAHGACGLARRHHQSLCVLCFDLDHFKQINDRYGHDGGDAVLVRVTRALQGLLRASDVAARFGGEEFVVALPQTDLEMAQQVAERIRASFAAQDIEFKGQTIRFTASFGLAQMTPDELDVNEGIHAALARADHALYQSKHEGRNRVTVAH
jgi:diguanylate cyclase (GGDEF)-like protein